MDIQELSDRAEIADAIIRYTRAIDTREWDLLDTVFAPGARVDYTESGGAATEHPAVKAWLSENLPAFSQRYLHTLGQLSYEFAACGEEAEVAAYFHNPMVIADGSGGERVVEVGGIYHHAFVRTAEGWRSRRLREQVVWTRGF
ncbi:MAG: nuclear transport factor 2 family protein [Nocardioidaceae bacterium]|nr:nuclear transport factor 2 family protein [Nocardioidaceae bacterium]MCL2614727.1 nuclear transport factor 2 family protein [Nocardioidaceae bacterium]